MRLVRKSSEIVANHSNAFALGLLASAVARLSIGAVLVGSTLVGTTILGAGSVAPATGVTSASPNPIGQTATSADDNLALVRAERAFAQLNQERGQRQAWLAWFAEDGVMFEPGPVNARKAMGEIKDSDAAPPGAFDWRPVIGLISRSGDLGFNAGPVRVGKGNPSTSSFFSIWKKQPDGNWRVLVDLGVPTDYKAHDPFEDNFVLLPAGPAATIVEPGGVGAGRGGAAALEAIEKSARSGAALLDRIDADSRGLRVGLPVLVGTDGFKPQLTATELAMEPLGSGVSRAGDFGYTYGSFRFGGANGEHGHYARAWRRNATGDWRIIFEAMRRER